MGETSRAVVGTIAPPLASEILNARRHRHRPLTGTAGILLFACMFLPAMKGCATSSVMPMDVPPFLPPYLYGLVFAGIALARTRRGLRAGTMVLRVLATVITFAGFIVFLVAPAIGIVELSVGLALIATIGTRGVSEVRIAATALLLGAVCTLWFGMWCTLEDSLLGVHLSLASSIGLFLGGMMWFGELLRAPDERVPLAVVHRRHRRPHRAP